jgi:hypothetical protein
VVEIAQENKIATGRKMRVDTTVVETDIHYPTDSSLLGDGVRVLTRIMKKVTAVAGKAGTQMRSGQLPAGFTFASGATWRGLSVCRVGTLADTVFDDETSAPPKVGARPARVRAARLFRRLSVARGFYRLSAGSHQRRERVIFLKSETAMVLAPTCMREVFRPICPRRSIAQDWH